MRNAIAVCTLSIFLFTASIRAQTPPADSVKQAPPTQSQPLQRRDQAAIATLHVRAKLVIIDVVVTGKDRAPYKGLKQSDFTLTEAGVPQAIKSFEEHTGITPTEALKFPPLPPLPPGIFTNYTPTPINSAVNLLLLDALNTPLQDQTFVRNQLLDYVKKARPGTSIAIFGLTTRLSMLQGFTSSPDVLREAIKITSGKSSPLLDDPVGGRPAESITDQMSEFGPNPAQAAGALADFESMRTSFQLQLRAKYTLDALNVLAHFLANIPGRKNLIWFSGSFPINILPDGDTGNPFLAVASAENEYRDTTNLLTRSQVAVYPVDARGLTTAPMFDASSSGAAYARNPRAMGSDLMKFSASQAAEHSTMLRMAEDTGGEAFINTNGLSQAVSKAIDSGSNYYTLTYTPTNTRWKGDFRRIQVKLSQPGYKLFYRKGYYADDPDSPSTAMNLAPPKPGPGQARATGPTAENKPDPSMILAMTHGLPGGTQVIYKLRVEPASAITEDHASPADVTGAPGFAPVKGPFQRVVLDYAADPRDLTFTLTPDGLYHCSIEVVALVYDPEGRVAIAHTDILKGAFAQSHLASIRRSGFPIHQEISVPARGLYTLRTGIRDIISNHIGALELPIASIRSLPPLKPPAPVAPPAK